MRSDLPLAGNRSSSLVTVLVGVMVFLAVLAAAGGLALNNVLDRWTHDVAGNLTAQIPPVPGLGEDARAATDARVARALEVLDAYPGVAAARALTEDELVTLIEPWIGSGEVLNDLPMPRLIDITMRPDALPGLDPGAMAQVLRTAVPGATLDEHRLWLSRLLDLGEAVGWLGVTVVLVVGLATAVAVVHATLAGLSTHRPVIEVLHMIGAQDDYIARQFAAHALRQGLKGGAGGFMLALPALAGLGLLAGRVKGGLVPTVGLSVLDWIVLTLLPFAAAGLVMLTARLTVLRTLARMP
ncbi:cell division protein [Roseospira marina]|uniref:Cell division protein n=1 Tax=Roseospira marina TaxID=140057 RepID=A0A5M6I970_9PROT|nr:cell division protein [Roseospira marina]KAA5604497.1 cell division protein [Roseospira marina]MBB4315551.1 cell division transport system permease protein [Roseospira marina]MBB5088512.1 cell division transport system permease protein [Roseospira marina]